MFYEMSENRIGTNVDEIRDKETEIKSLREYTMNIDFCGDNQESLMQRAKNLAIIGRSNFGCDFFKNYGIELNYAEDVQYLPFVDEEQQYIHRYRIVVHLSRWDSVILPQQTAIVIEPHIENVDVHHTP